MWSALVPEVDVVDGGLLSEGVEGVIDVAEREPAAGEVDGGQGQPRAGCG